jgi:hypothetical protein
MRRLWMGQLALLLAITALVGPARFARAAEIPTEGNWKIVFLFQGMGPQGPILVDVNAWVISLNLDKSKGKEKVEVLSALRAPVFKGSEGGKITTSANSLHFAIKADRNAEFRTAFYLDKAKGKAGPLLGTVLFNGAYCPARLEKTEGKEIDARPEQNPAGLADLNAALQEKDAEERFKDLEDVVKTYEGKPIVFFTSLRMIAELFQKKSDAAAFKPVAQGYLKTAALYGPEMEVQANLNLARELLNHDKTAALALTYAEDAVKLLKKVDYRGTRLTAYVTLANALSRNKKDEDVKNALEKIRAITDDVIEHPRIPAPKWLTNYQMANVLLASSAPSVADAGLTYARTAEKLVPDDAPATDRLAVALQLHNGLMNRGQARKDDKMMADARKLEPKIEKIHEEIDKEYLKNIISFKTEKFAGRKGKSDRAVVVELFTCIQAPQVAAAQVGMDALAQSYSPREVVLLDYHIHLEKGGKVVGLDPLANPATEARAKFYEMDMEIPSVFIDGKSPAELPGGELIHAKTRYAGYRELIDKALESNAEAKIKLEVKRKGDKIEMSANVSELKALGKAKLHLLLVEPRVRFQGRNGLRLQHHVVRAMPTGAGIKLDKKESAHKSSLDLTEVRKESITYLNTIAKKAGAGNFQVPFALKDLVVVALVQEDESKKILQAVQVAVPEPIKEEKKEDKKVKEKDKD